MFNSEAVYSGMMSMGLTRQQTVVTDKYDLKYEYIDETTFFLKFGNVEIAATIETNNLMILLLLLPW